MAATDRTEMMDLLETISTGLRRRLKAACEAQGIPFSSLLMMRRVDRLEGVTVSELARLSGMAKSHTSRLVEDLERQGLVEKRTDTADQRLLRIHLTGRARELLAGVQQSMAAQLSRVMDGIPPEQLQAVVVGLRIVAAGMKGTGREYPEG